MRIEEGLSNSQAKTMRWLLVAEVGTVLVISAQVSIVWRRGAEEDGGRQVIASAFEELVHLAGHTGLNGHSVP